MKHELKILPAYFEAVLCGDKTFEVRDNADRGFQKGDTVLLREVHPGALADRYTGRALERRVTYVTNYGQKDGYVVFGLSAHPLDPSYLLERAEDAIDALVGKSAITNEQELQQYRDLITAMRRARQS